MNIYASTRRIASGCASSRPLLVNCHQRRTAMKDFLKKGSSESNEQQPKQANPILDDYLDKNPRTTAPVQAMPKPGDLASSSIFEQDRRVDGQSQVSDEPLKPEGLPGRKWASMSRLIDPDPNSRERWERKKVIQLVRRGGRLNRREFIARTEREHLVKSHNLKTSVKKLGKLARQIAGKTIDDAIVQMRFSKKKAAVEVLEQLEAARDEAVVVRGMGLGQVVPKDAEEEGGEDQQRQQQEQPVEIRLKDGRRHLVKDPSKIYIDQAWVGRGPYGKLPEYRARGRVNILRTPWTSISVLLKEEATRVREWEDREAKLKKQRTGKKVWVAMPDRPIPTQRQWYSW